MLDALIAVIAVGLPGGTNWFDAVVLVALIYGVCRGVRSGLSGEIIGVVGLVLSVVLAVNGYMVLAGQLQNFATITPEVANVVAFVTIAIIVYLVSVVVRTSVHKRMKKYRLSATVENMGGALAGLVRMVVVMAWVCVMLCLLRSNFWHRQVEQESLFGSYVIGQLPVVAAMTKQHFPDEFFLLREIKRRPDPDIE